MSVTPGFDFLASGVDPQEPTGYWDPAFGWRGPGDEFAGETVPEENWRAWRALARLCRELGQPRPDCNGGCRPPVRRAALRPIRAELG